MHWNAIFGVHVYAFALKSVIPIGSELLEYEACDMVLTDFTHFWYSPCQ